MRRSAVKRWFKSLLQDNPSWSLFTFGQLSCFSLHTCLVSGPSPRRVCNFSWRWVPPQIQRVGHGTSTLDLGWSPSPFLIPKETSCVDGESLPWPQERSSCLFASAELSFCHKLCPWSVWVRTKLQFCSTWWTPAVQPRSLSISYIKIIRKKKKNITEDHRNNKIKSLFLIKSLLKN